ncbi:hypothetical protein TNCV_3868461 [Trichonephila clavipes]|nr:hypothetical protein TNCV_3868461 [Trichonephila clavipes]
MLQPEVVPFLQYISGAVLQQNNARPDVAKTVQDFCSAQHIQLLPLSAYSSVMEPIQCVWDLVGSRLTREPRTAASKELLLRIQAIWKSLLQKQTFKIYLTPCHVLYSTFCSVWWIHKYSFQTLNIVFLL